MKKTLFEDIRNPRIVTWLNYKPKPGKRITAPSMTVPDQTMSIREILDRYARGLPIEGQKVPMYDGDEFVPDIAHMDLVDVDEMRRNNADRILHIQKNLNKERTVKAEVKTDSPDASLQSLPREPVA